MRVTLLTPVQSRKLTLWSRGITTAQLATEAQCSVSMIRAVIRGDEPSRRIRKIIARAMGVSVKRAFR
jgi:lambda repressor-like predicted transcriptional regulator